METKSARLTVLIDPFKKKAFEQLCAAQDLTPSQVVRQMIRDYLEQHGVSYKTRSTVAVRGAAKPQSRRKPAA
ncbi:MULTISPECIES: ribbon-helix-helix protein, CopG family [Burkholderia]|uniref:CopG family transcriptional regulator n=2 Tax=Burkholderia humptydooensis TaxID=430531 RepID=A0A7U4P9Y4_9BURK|nr:MULTISPECIES: ribbon-helix-helix protein, CopG family [Burkholderia]AGK50124.1 ribbon-helix-helix, copG family protein [Burkholderia thailandensis MSMB121]ATF32703.1 CopG family transcriptional regulator [Burkholderia thailandensis]AJY38470.1 ribbon-helix-helix, copG family protein [Burkholderia sp. 2002721687]ALX45680.1 CopG family transcriptional regulator [Burkholderia humptydooensis]EIP86640.1 thioredoxin [Burkholderia humptydooensis MSMB43]